jgi:hypothetical protein
LWGALVEEFAEALRRPARRARHRGLRPRYGRLTNRQPGVRGWGRGTPAVEAAVRS